MDKTSLRPSLKKIHWAVPLFGFLLLLASPIVMPILVMIQNRDDVLQYFAEAIRAIKYKPWGQK